MPAELNEGQDPSSRPEDDGSSQREIATASGASDDAALSVAQKEALHDEISKILRQQEQQSRLPAPSDPPNLTGAEVVEKKVPKTMTGNPVLAYGDQLELKRENMRGRLAMIVVAIFGTVLIAYVVATFRLEPTEGVRELREMITILIPVTVGGALVAHYFKKSK